MVRVPRRTLGDRTPDQGAMLARLVSWVKVRWRPEHPPGGVDVEVNGQRVQR